jgi:UDP:flavonoid glycosyltransferase YjiC (YdhE family)
VLAAAFADRREGCGVRASRGNSSGLASNSAPCPIPQTGSFFCEVAIILVLATAGAGGDFQPLAAVALALRDRGHQVTFLGDSSVARVLDEFGAETVVSPTELDLGPRLAQAVREAMELSPSDPGPIVEQRLSQWAEDFSPVLHRMIGEREPALVATSLLGIEVAHLSVPKEIASCVVNSTFYFGPNPPRPIEEDFAPRATPLFRHFARLLAGMDLVLHATDRTFDLSFDGLPPGNHYVGPLGIWEPPGAVPTYLDEPGDPWILVTISSQAQDDLPLARGVIDAVGNMDVRALVTTGGAHDPVALGETPPNVHLESYIPHTAVLGRASLLVSHAGHGSVMKALWNGVPMVLVPWGRDQPSVAARAARLGVAEVLKRDELTPEWLHAAALSVMGNASYRESAARHSRRLRLGRSCFESRFAG